MPVIVKLPLSSTKNTVVEAVSTNCNKLPEPQTVSLEYGVVVPMPMLPPSNMVNTSVAPSKKLAMSPLESCLTDSMVAEEEACI